MKKIAYIFFPLLIAFFFFSCGPDLPNGVDVAYKELPKKIDFNFHVRPILSDRCFHCHGPDENGRSAGLRLDVRDSVIHPLNSSGKIPIVAGKANKSEVIARILSHDSKLVMPTAESKLTLTDKEKAILVKWIEQGADYKEHWAYITPVKNELPKVEEENWPKNEIDYFVLNKLESNKLQPSKKANKETLIRRVSLDLTGIPPSLEDIKAFVNDNSNDAYEKLVDRLLVSKNYGERWAWEWMDVSRYADTNGFQNDPTRTMWPWRDWVIKAFNENMPYDQFTIKQLAGDLLPDATTEDILATGFCRNNAFNGEGGREAEERRVENVIDRTETMGTTWLGLPLECCRCHDHKFDAISQKEYYQFYDYFNQMSESGNQITGQIAPIIDVSAPKEKEKLAAIEEYADKLAHDLENFEKKKFPRPEGVSAQDSDVAKNLKGVNTEYLKYPPKNRYPFHNKLLADYFKNRDRKYSKKLMTFWKAKDSAAKAKDNNLNIMVMDQLDSPRTTFVLDRGTYNKYGDTVTSGVPKVLPQITQTKNDRLALAKWIVSKENPLTARVTVNRYWQHFFGNGIVKTIDDFGVQGALPTHPELLDWLAVDFQENGWDLKKIFKTIVMSATYRQTSKVTPKLLEVDPENKLLARATRMRLPSWMLRDQALALSGVLVDSIGGEPTKPYQPQGIWAEATFGKIKYEQDHGDNLYRRTLYSFWRRIVGPTMLFDNAARQKCSVKTLRTNTPLHALTTLNDITYVEASRILAEKILTEKTNDNERISYLFELTTSRKPNDKEAEILHNRLKDLRKDFKDSIEEVQKLINVGEYKVNTELDTTDYAAYTVLSSLALNLDETITRQ